MRGAEAQWHDGGEEDLLILLVLDFYPLSKFFNDNSLKIVFVQIMILKYVHSILKEWNEIFVNLSQFRHLFDLANFSSALKI